MTAQPEPIPARLSAVVLVGGRVVATWEHKALKRSVRVTVTPLSRGSDSHRSAVEADAERLAHHLAREGVELKVG